MTRPSIGDLLREAGSAGARSPQLDWPEASVPAPRTEPMLAVGRRRRRRRGVLRALGLLGLAVVAIVVVGLLRPPPPAPAGVATVILARPVAAGTSLRADDLELAVRPPSQRPDGALGDLADAVGHTSAGPLATGEVLTPARLVGPALLTGAPDGTRAMSVPILTGAGLGLSGGAHVDLFRSDTGTPVAQDVLVLAAVGPGGSLDRGGMDVSGTGSPLGAERGGAVADSWPSSVDPAAGGLVVAVSASQAEAVAAGLGAGGDLGFHVALRRPD